MKAVLFKKKYLFMGAGLACLMALTFLFVLLFQNRGCAMEYPSEATIKLPPPELAGSMTLEQTLMKRRSIRSYANIPISIKDVSQLIWAAQGVTDQQGFRTAPSAGALYPLEVYIVSTNVNQLPPGLYRYLPASHELYCIYNGNLRARLLRAGLGQSAIREAPAVIVLTAVYERTMRKYGNRGVRYADMEAGHAAENICLQAVALGLGVVPIGAFDDQKLREILKLEKAETPLYLLPVGKPHSDK